MAGTDQESTAGEPAADATPAENTDTEFDAAFSEFAADDAAPAEQADATTDAKDQGDPGDETRPPEAPAAEQPPATGDEPPAADKTKDAPASGASEEPKDIWADAPPELKAAHEAAAKQLEAERHENRSNRTRMSTLTRKLTAAEQAAANAPAPEAGDRSQTEAVETDEEKNFKTDYPEVSGPVATMLQRRDARIETQTSEIQSLKTRLDGIDDQNAQTQINAEEAVLADAHSDWSTVVQSTEFSTWLAGQPRYIQDGLARNGDAIVDGNEAASLISMFKDSQPAPTNEPPATPKGDGEDPPKNGLDARSQRRLESAVSTPGGAPGSGSGPPNGDYEAAFNYFADQPEP